MTKVEVFDVATIGCSESTAPRIGWKLTGA